jgi:hypothetical protein
MQLQYQLIIPKKDNLSIIYYFQRMKSFVETLGLIDQPLNDFEVVYILHFGWTSC